MFKCFWLQNMHVTLSVLKPPPFPPPSQPSIHLGMKTAARILTAPASSQPRAWMWRGLELCPGTSLCRMRVQ